MGVHRSAAILKRSRCSALRRLAAWERNSLHWETMPVVSWTSLAAEEVLLRFCPPGPRVRKAEKAHCRSRASSSRERRASMSIAPGSCVPAMPAMAGRPPDGFKSDPEIAKAQRGSQARMSDSPLNFPLPSLCASATLRCADAAVIEWTGAATAVPLQGDSSMTQAISPPAASREAAPAPRRTQPPLRLDPRFMAKLDRLDLVSRKLLQGKMKGERRSKRRGQSVEFADFRNYVVGDDLRFIDWNVYARLEKLFLKLFLEEEDLALYLLCDMSRSTDYGNPNKAYYVKQVAAALGYVGLVNYNRVTVAAISDTVVADTGGLR